MQDERDTSDESLSSLSTGFVTLTFLLYRGTFVTVAAAFANLCLKLSTVDDGGWVRIGNCARVAPGGLNGFHNLHGSVISYFTKDNVFAVEPAGRDRGDEEL